MGASPGNGSAGISAQNDAENLELLAAASHFYGWAKRVAGLQFLLTVPVAMVSYSVLLIFPAAKLWTTFLALSIALIDNLILERVQGRLRQSGALAQERFDCRLFGLPWNQFLCQRALEAAEISKAAGACRKRDSSLTALKNWYPPIASEVRPDFANLICQRSAVRWDSAQRRRYAICLAIASAAVLFLLIVVALYENYSMGDFILRLYAPIAPAILWTGREICRHREAADKLDALRSSIDGVWSAIASGMEKASPTRAIQDALFQARSRNALVFDWIYRLQRSEQETAMQVNAKEMVARLKKLPS